MQKIINLIPIPTILKRNQRLSLRKLKIKFSIYQFQHHMVCIVKYFLLKILMLKLTYNIPLIHIYCKLLLIEQCFILLITRFSSFSDFKRFIFFMHIFFYYQSYKKLQIQRIC